MTTNIINFSKFPWATQCLEMKHTSARESSDYSPDEFMCCIRRGDYCDALSRNASVGSWLHSIQGARYWRNIYASILYM